MQIFWVASNCRPQRFLAPLLRRERYVEGVRFRSSHRLWTWVAKIGTSQEKSQTHQERYGDIRDIIEKTPGWLMMWGYTIISWIQ